MITVLLREWLGVQEEDAAGWRVGGEAVSPGAADTRGGQEVVELEICHGHAEELGDGEEDLLRGGRHFATSAGCPAHSQ